MDGLLEKARKQLVKKGYKWTGQRRDIITNLFNDSSRHISAEELHGILQKQELEIGLATVYRTLELMVEVGLAHKLQFGDGRSRFELADDEHHHHHLVCNKCGSIYEVSMDLLEQLEHKIEVDYNFTILGHHLKFYGLCSNCKHGKG